MLRPAINPGTAHKTATTGAIAVTAIDVDTNVFSVAAGYGFSNTWAFTLTTTGTLPAPLALNTTYYISGLSTNDFTLSATSGGAAIDITDDGDGTMSLVSGPTIYHLSADGNTLWGMGGNAIFSHNLMYSTDGVTWTQKIDIDNVTGIQWYEVMINGVLTFPDSATDIIITGGPGIFNSNTGTNGMIFVSADGGATFTRKLATIKGGGTHWNMDANADYAIIGTYGNAAAAGDIDRDVWLTTDNGANFASCFHIEGDGSATAITTHVHAARIDPDGGCWVSVGDSSPYVGLWHSVAQPSTVATDGGHTSGDFSLIYTDGNARPLVGIFHTGNAGEKYYFVGEDVKTNATISRIRYDAVAITSVDNTANTFTLAGHTLANGDVLRLFTTDTLPTGFSLATNYYVVEATATTFQLSATRGGAAVNFSDDGTGTHSYNYQVRTMADFTTSHSFTIPTGACKFTGQCWVFVGQGHCAITYDAGNSWLYDNTLFNYTGTFPPCIREPFHRQIAGGGSYAASFGSIASPPLGKRLGKRGR